MARSRGSWWIDGYNVLHGLRMGQGGSWEERRAELIHRAAALRRPCWIVFDSRRGVGGVPKAPGRVRVRFASEGRTADEVILQRVMSVRNLDGVVVVTDDQELARNCRLHGAHTCPVKEFARHLLPAPPDTPDAPPRDRRLSRQEVEDWLQWFGRDPGAPPADPDP